MLLALAVLVGGGPLMVRRRAGLVPNTHGSRRRGAIGSDPLATASSLDVLALCLASGMAVADAAALTSRSAPPRLAHVLRRGADLLVLGADPATAWSPAPDQPRQSVPRSTDALLRLARRSGSSGTALAAGVAELSAQCRHDASHAAAATAERAGVLMAGPLAICFLPAFVCLGIVPVVVSLTDELLQSGLL